MNKDDLKFTKRFKSDYEILKENFKFIWDEHDEEKRDDSEDHTKEWEKQLAKKYYDRLYKEYGIADLTYYKKGKIGLRWCNEKDIICKKGLVTCGNTACNYRGKLKSFEVNSKFRKVNMKYQEKDQIKNALVKVNLCEECGEKINYRFDKKKRKKEEKN